MFGRLGGAVVRWRLGVVIGWLALAVLAVLFVPPLSSVGSADEAGFLPAEADSMVARRMLLGAFPADASEGSATVVFSREEGLTDDDHREIAAFSAWLTSDEAPAAVRDVVSGVRGADLRPELAALFRSPDGSVELLDVRMRVAAFQGAANDAVEGMRAELASRAMGGLEASVSGAAGIGRDYLAAVVEGTDRTTLVTIVLLVAVLLLIYRAPVAAVVPLVTIGLAFLVSRGALGALAAAGWRIPALLDSFVVVLVFGVGTDYAIFLISRYREELAGSSVLDAAVRAETRIGAVITASAATVMVGLAAMAAGRFGMITTLGPAMALTIAITLVAGLTLTPALLVLAGHRLFWPRHAEVTDPVRLARIGRWDRLATFTARRPLRVAGQVGLALALPLLALPALQLNFDALEELPPISDARAGYEQVAAHFDRGQLLPVTVMVERAGDAGQGVDHPDLDAPAGLALLARVTTELAGTPGVRSVRSLTSPAGDGTTPDTLRPSVQLAAMAERLRSGGDPAADLARLRDPATLGALDAALAYLDGLSAAYPELAGEPSMLAASADLALLRSALADLAEAPPGGELAVLAGVAGVAVRLPDELVAAAQLWRGRADDLFLPRALDQDGQLGRLLESYLSVDGGVARLYLVTADDPYSTAAFETVRRARETLAATLSRAGSEEGARTVAAVGGPTAEGADVQSTLAEDFRRIALLTVLGITVVLAILLRSLVAPVYLVLSVLLSYGTTLGLCVLLFQGLMGQPGINSVVPLVVFVLLVALGSDYNIFLVSRVREESERRGLRAGITVASARTGTVITSAGIILAGTFAALVVAPLQVLFQTGVAVAMGVLIDTFLVRSLFIPALMTIIGRWSWWPSAVGAARPERGVARP